MSILTIASTGWDEINPSMGEKGKKEKRRKGGKEKKRKREKTMNCLDHDHDFLDCCRNASALATAA